MCPQVYDQILVELHIAKVVCMDFQCFGVWTYFCVFYLDAIGGCVDLLQSTGYWELFCYIDINYHRVTGLFLDFWVRTELGRTKLALHGVGVEKVVAVHIATDAPVALQFVVIGSVADPAHFQRKASCASLDFACRTQIRCVIDEGVIWTYPGFHIK